MRARFSWICSHHKYQGGRWVAWRSAQRCWTLRGSEDLGSIRLYTVRPSALSVPLLAQVNGFPLNLPTVSYKRDGHPQASVKVRCVYSTGSLPATSPPAMGLEYWVLRNGAVAYWAEPITP